MTHFSSLLFRLLVPTSRKPQDRCDEKAYQLLMRIYAMQEQRSETLRQYQRCECILAEELGAAPALETVNLLRTLLACKHFSDEVIERK